MSTQIEEMTGCRLWFVDVGIPIKLEDQTLCRGTSDPKKWINIHHACGICTCIDIYIYKYIIYCDFFLHTHICGIMPACLKIWGLIFFRFLHQCKFSIYLGGFRNFGESSSCSISFAPDRSLLKWVGHETFVIIPSHEGKKWVNSSNIVI